MVYEDFEPEHRLGAGLKAWHATPSSGWGVAFLCVGLMFFVALVNMGVIR